VKFKLNHYFVLIIEQMLEDISGETPFTQSCGVSDSYRWFAPELLDSTGSLSTSSDIYSYGMTVLEVCPPVEVRFHADLFLLNHRY
jgi:serine/threonine protein kinase